MTIWQFAICGYLVVGGVLIMWIAPETVEESREEFEKRGPAVPDFMAWLISGLIMVLLWGPILAVFLAKGDADDD